MEFFQDTLLNRIISDLQPIIKDYYRTYPKFIIGPYTAEYDDYCLIEKTHFDDPSFIKLLQNFYGDNKGFPCIEDFYGNILYGLDFILYYQVYFFRMNNENNNALFIEKGTITAFITSVHDCDDILKNIDGICIRYPYMNHINKEMGLFVKHNN